MPRRRRWDLPDSWHHVMNRGVGQRSLFESVEDVRYFRSRLAQAVRRGELEVHAWCALTTHFHLLVRSPGGRMHEGMRRIQHEYSRWFNRRRGRDGPLYRSRFTSRCIDSYGYRRIVVRYIDANAVNAGMAVRAADFLHGSARDYAGRRGPPWLQRGWIERETLRATGSSVFDARQYEIAFPPLLAPQAREWVERRLASNATEPDCLDDLLAAGGERFLDWLWRKTAMADGTRPGLPIASPSAVMSALTQTRERIGHTPPIDEADWTTLRIGMLRDAAAATYDEIGGLLELTPARACSLRARHARRVRASPVYARLAAHVGREALAAVQDEPPLVRARSHGAG